MSGQRKILYISYDGMTDPLGQSQVLPYLTRLAGCGHSITILSCEKRGRLTDEFREVAELCQRTGIEWRPIPYHKQPPVLSSVYDLQMLKRRAVQLHVARNFEIIHCRSYIPAIVGLSLKRRFGARLLFDMRGFWPEEKVEGGSWQLRNPLFRHIYAYFKRREAELLHESDHIVTLTEAAKSEIETRPILADRKPDISVIPCCVDLDHFSPVGTALRARARQELGLAPHREVLTYLGSLGGTYLLDEMLRFFLHYRQRRKDAVFLFITRHNPAAIRKAAAGLGLSIEEVLIVSATRDQVPLFLAAADAGVAFTQPSFSAKACSPTKLGEMLAMGIPVVANAGVGDVDGIISETGAGVLVNAFDEDSLAQAAEALPAPGLHAAEIRGAARHWFSLEEGVRQYIHIYEMLA